MAMRHIHDSLDDIVHQRQQGLVARLAQHERIGQVIDVLGGAGKVNEFADRFQFLVAGDFLLEEIFHRLDVMVGGALDVLDTLCIRFVEFFNEVIEHMVGVVAERRHFTDVFLSRQRLQPADLDLHAMTDQPVLAEDGPQGFGFRSITAVDG